MLISEEGQDRGEEEFKELFKSIANVYFRLYWFSRNLKFHK